MRERLLLYGSGALRCGEGSERGRGGGREEEFKRGKVGGCLRIEGYENAGAGGGKAEEGNEDESAKGCVA